MLPCPQETYTLEVRWMSTFHKVCYGVESVDFGPRGSYHFIYSNTFKMGKLSIVM